MTDDREDWMRHGRSFGAVAGAYAELRPGYPDGVAGFLLGSRPRRVLDLGAGTGKLSEALLAAGHEVVAIDPALEMLAELRDRHPDVQTAVGTAEAIPLPDDAADAVVAGQAAHWFDPGAAGPEIARVLRPGGVVGLVWNLRDERVPWVAALSELLADSHVMTEVDETVFSLAEVLGHQVERAEFGHVHSLALELMVDSIGTRSRVALLEAAARDQLLQAARNLFATHPDTAGRNVLDHPYRTLAYKLTPSPTQ